MAGHPYDRFGEELTGVKSGSSHEHKSRSAVSKDRDRIIHCGAFRRLQRKSQIVGVQSSDFFRTRLTHTVECAQIGRGIGLRSLSSGKRLEGVVEEVEHLPDLIEAACLAHDLGHPPFGHNGEKALQSMMYKHARRSFEGNAQSFRIVTNLEPKVQAGERWCGLDLTRTTLKAILKYPWDENDERAKKKGKFCLYDQPDDRAVFDWLFEGEKLDCTIATHILETADDIAYAVHDFEDGVWSGMIPLFRLYDETKTEARDLLIKKVEELDARDGDDLFAEADFDSLFEQLLPNPDSDPWATVPFDRSRDARAGLKNFSAGLIGEFIKAVTPEDSFEAPAGDVKRRLRLLTGMARVWMIESASQETLRFGQQRLIEDLFEGYWSNAKMLQRETWARVGNPAQNDRDLSGEKGALEPEELPIWQAKARVICDHVSGMTDLYALHMHSEMFAGGSPPNLRVV
jgi:dGTPase